MRVVADTNVFISALMFGGLPGRFLDLALGHRFNLVTSKALLDELDEKLRGKFGVSESDALAICAKLEGNAQGVQQPRLVADHEVRRDGMVEVGNGPGGHCRPHG